MRDTTRFGLFLVSLLLSQVRSLSLFSMASATPPPSSGDMRFGKFLIPTNSIFFRGKKSAAFVNLRPIVPGHVLVMPERIVPTMDELTEEEYVDMWKSVRIVQSALRHKYDATAFNVAVQDGRAAGQSVPHVHVHILPRKVSCFNHSYLSCPVITFARSHCCLRIRYAQPYR